MTQPTIIATYHVNILDNDTPVDFVALVRDADGTYHLNECAADGTLINPGTAIENVRPISVDNDDVKDYILTGASQNGPQHNLHARDGRGSQHIFDLDALNTDFYDDLNADGKMDSWSYQRSLGGRRIDSATSVYKITPTYVPEQNK